MGDAQRPKDRLTFIEFVVLHMLLVFLAIVAFAAIGSACVAVSKGHWDCVYGFAIGFAALFGIAATFDKITGAI